MKKFSRVMPLFLVLTIVTMGTPVWAGAVDADQDAAAALMGLSAVREFHASAEGDRQPLKGKRAAAPCLDEAEGLDQAPPTKKSQSDVLEAVSSYLEAYKKTGAKKQLPFLQWRSKLLTEKKVSEQDLKNTDFRAQLWDLLFDESLLLPESVSRYHTMSKNMKESIEIEWKRTNTPYTIQEWKDYLIAKGCATRATFQGKNGDCGLRRHLERRGYLVLEKDKATRKVKVVKGALKKQGSFNTRNMDSEEKEVIEHTELYTRMTQFFEGYFETEMELERALEKGEPFKELPMDEVFYMKEDVIEQVKADVVKEYATERTMKDWCDLLREYGVIQKTDKPTDIRRSLGEMSQFYPLMQ